MAARAATSVRNLLGRIAATPRALRYSTNPGRTVGTIDQGVKLQGETERFQLAVTEIENLGPNPGLVGKGQGVDGASGRALLAQRDSGMTELSPIFEQHRDWKLRIYRKLWNRCRQAWTAERWIRNWTVPRISSASCTVK
jgi:hypothetical protein